MRYHAVVHGDNNKSVFECHVMADSPGQASDKVKAHLRKSGRDEHARMLVTLVEYREDIESKLPLISG